MSDEQKSRIEASKAAGRAANYEGNVPHSAVAGRNDAAWGILSPQELVAGAQEVAEGHLWQLRTCAMTWICNSSIRSRAGGTRG